MTNLTNNNIDDGDELLEVGTVKGEKIFGRNSENFRRSLSKQLMDSAWTFGKDFQERMEARIGALEAWRGFEPRDVVEALLVAQIYGTHNAVMGYFHWLALETLRPEEQERAANRVTQLTGIFQNQIAALDKHRGAGQQRIRVEKVTVVEAGGQAIVGNIETPALGAAGSASLPPPVPVIDLGASATRPTNVRSRTRASNDPQGPDNRRARNR